MNPTYDFAGQVALVTGASSGMGFATAQAFAEAGASVVLADINENALRAATDGLTTAGHTALGVTCDVSDEEEVAALVAHARPVFHPALYPEAKALPMRLLRQSHGFTS
jgi:NAD(P)-dependent dehydrogenase (short-subunit alcohol dehydrogenase family)